MSVKERNKILTRKRWIILAASCIANLCIGAVYAWSVFAGHMAEHFNALNGTALTAADLAYIFSFTTGVEFITSIAGGWYPTYTDWNREKEVDEHRDYVLKRANAEWKRRLEEAPTDLLDPECEKELDAYIAAHSK